MKKPPRRKKDEPMLPVSRANKNRLLSTVALGARLRVLRRRHGLTLDQLAQETDLNKGYLSRIENGQKLPSISTALKLAKVLGVQTNALFGESVDDVDIRVVLKKDRLIVGEASSQALLSLSNGALSSHLQSFILQPPSEFEYDDRAEHSGTEGIFVINGKIEIRFADRNLLLAAGDYVQFSGHLSHQVRRKSSAATILIVIARG